jgi:DNA polymerase-3 subunit delta
LNYLDAPTQSTVLAFCYKNGKVDGRSSLFKTLKAKAKTFESAAIKENQLPTWVQNIAKDQGLTIRGTATQLLADYLGSDLHKLTNEISKLSIVLNQGDEITTQIIQDHIGISKDYNVWELQTALIRKDVLKANQIINFFEKNPKDHPLFQIIPALYGFFAKLCVIQNSSNKDEAYKELGVNYYAAQNYKEGEKNYSPGKSERIIKYFRDADEQLKGLKGNSMSHGDIMRELIFKILH